MQQVNSNFEFVILIVLGLAYIWTAVCLQRIAQKAQAERSWLAWVPVGNLFLMCRLASTSPWWVLLCLIPYVGFLFSIILACRVPRALGITGGSRFLMIVPLVNLLYLGYLAFRQEPSLTVNPRLS